MSGWGEALLKKLGQDGSKWQCPTCLTYNGRDLTACACCETLNPEAGGGGARATAPVVAVQSGSAASMFGAPAPVTAASMFSAPPPAHMTAASMFAAPRAPAFGSFGQPPAPSAAALMFGSPAPAPLHFGVAPSPAHDDNVLSLSALHSRAPADAFKRAVAEALLPPLPTTCHSCMGIYPLTQLSCPSCGAPNMRSNPVRHAPAALPIPPPPPPSHAAAASPAPAFRWGTTLAANAPMPSFTAPPPAFSFAPAPAPVPAPAPAPSFAAAAPPKPPAPAPPKPAVGAASSEQTMERRDLGGSMSRDTFPPATAYVSPPGACVGALVHAGAQGVEDYELFALPLQLLKDAAPAPKAKRGKKSPAAAVPAFAILTAGSGECEQLGHGGDEALREEFTLERPAILLALARLQIARVAVGGLHSLVLTTEGAVWSWGCNDDSALGRAGSENRPGLVRGALAATRIVALSAGDSHSAALDAAGTAYAWGTYKGADGALGFEHTGAIKAAREPIALTDVRVRFGPVVALSSGADHTGVLTAAGRAVVWGYGQQGQLARATVQKGDAGATPEEVCRQLRPEAVHLSRCAGKRAPPMPPPLHPGAAALTLALVPAIVGAEVSVPVKAAGGGRRGQKKVAVAAEAPPAAPAGTGARGKRGGASASSSGDGTAAPVARGAKRGRGASSDGTEDGTGAGAGAGVGAGAGAGASAGAGAGSGATAATGGAVDVISIIAGSPEGAVPLTEQPIARLWCAGYSTFILTGPDGTGAGGGLVYAFGLNSYGQLGLGDTADRAVPTLVRALSAPLPPGGGVVSIVGGAQHTLALTSDGGVLVMGRGDSGQLGLASPDAAKDAKIAVAAAAFTPRQISPAAFGDAPVVALTANGCSSAALTASGSLFTWGFGESGQLAHGIARDENMPRRVADDPLGEPVVAVGLGGQHIVILSTAEVDVDDEACEIVTDPVDPPTDDMS